MGPRRRPDPVLPGDHPRTGGALRQGGFLHASVYLSGVLERVCMDIIHRVNEWGRSAPGRRAHVSGGRSLTYGDLLRRSDALAAHLASVLPDDRSPVVVLG